MVLTSFINDIERSTNLLISFQLSNLSCSQVNTENRLEHKHNKYIKYDIC